MPRPITMLAVSLLSTAALAGCSGTSDAGTGTSGPLQKTVGDSGAGHLLPVRDRRPAPAISGQTLDGNALDLAAYRGKVLVLNFWASWCDPCRAESPTLVRTAQATSALGVAFVGIDIKDTRSAARRFDAVHNVPYPSLFDQPGVVLTRLHEYVPQQPPSTLLIDKAGRIAELISGGVTDGTLDGPLRQLASEPA